MQGPSTSGVPQGGPFTPLSGLRGILAPRSLEGAFGLNTPRAAEPAEEVPADLQAEVQTRLAELEAELIARQRKATIERLAMAALKRDHPEAEVKDIFLPNAPGGLPDKPVKLPAPEKWSGELSILDTGSDALARRGKAWLLNFEHHCAVNYLQPEFVLNAFLKDKAQEWYYALYEYMYRSNTAVTWEFLKGEFLKQYSPLDRRSTATTARTRLMQGECTQQQYKTIARYEQAFKSLIRDCLDMSEADQISWFLQGLTPFYRKQCWNQPLDGTEWPSLNAAITYALGVEARQEAAYAQSAPVQKSGQAKTLAATTLPYPPHRQLPTPSKRHKGNSQGGPGAGTSSQVNPPPGVTGRAKSMWAIAMKHGWTAPDNKAYTADSFMSTYIARKCLKCHKSRAGSSPECQCARPESKGPRHK